MPNPDKQEAIDIGKRCEQCKMIIKSLDSRLPIIQKAYAYFMLLFCCFVGLFSYQRFKAIFNAEEGMFDIKIGITIT